jgi:hypothetical protein
MIGKWDQWRETEFASFTRAPLSIDRDLTELFLPNLPSLALVVSPLTRLHLLAGCHHPPTHSNILTLPHHLDNEIVITLRHRLIARAAGAAGGGRGTWTGGDSFYQ